MLMTSPNIFFGTAQDFPISFKLPAFEATIKEIATKLGLNRIVLNRQTHGVDGFIIDNKQPSSIDFRTREGDYLITQQPGIGIAVNTADCLPLIFYAPDKKVIASAHAGWRGSVAGIGVIIINRLKREFGIDPKQLKIWFGPAGKSCCYEVQKDFVPPQSDLIIERNGKLFFDNMALNYRQLLNAGILAENIDLSKNDCTICNPNYHSYRRAENKSLYNTQATIIWLS